MMKKALALLLSFMLVFSMTACSSSDSSSKDEEEEIEEEAETEEEAEEGEEDLSSDTEDYGDPENASLRFYWWGNQTRSEYTAAAIEIYEENHPGVSIEGQPYQIDDYWTVLSTAAAGNTMPDIMQHSYAYLSQYDASGLNLDLTPFVENGMLDVSNFSDEILETGTVNDHLLGICNGVNASAMIYNKTLTDSLGLEIKDNMSWDEFAEYCRIIHEETGVMTYYGYTRTSADGETCYLRGRGYDSMFTDDGLSYEEDGYGVMTEYYQRLIDGVDEGWLMDAVVLSGLDPTAVETSPLVYFTQEAYQSWEIIAYSNQLTAYQEAAPEDMDLALTACPSDDPKASNYMSPSQFFSLTKDVTNAAAAVSFLDALVNDIDMNMELKGERGVPASSVVAEALSDAGLLGEEEVHFLYDVIEPCCSTIFPPLADSTSEVINGPLANVAEQVLYGTLDADTAAQEFFDQAIAMLRGE